MKKSNWLISVVLVLVSAFLLWLWYRLGFNTIDSPLDLVLSIAWWVVLVLVVLLVAHFEKRRRAAVRTVFVADGLLFNSELGTVECTEPARRAEAIEDMLDSLAYKFHKEDMPSPDDVTFTMVVTSDVFKKKRGSKAQQGQAAAQTAASQAGAPQGAATPAGTTADAQERPEHEWKGSVIHVVRGGENQKVDVDGIEEFRRALA